MNIDSLNKWLSLTANLGVIVGIFFVVVEINQNNDLLAAQERFNRLEVVRGATALNLQDTHISDSLAIPATDRTDSQRRTVNTFLDYLILGLEWTYSELSEDELPIERWRARLGGNDFIRYWELTKYSYDPEFVEFIEQQIIGN